jgi:hypothetical protein
LSSGLQRQKLKDLEHKVSSKTFSIKCPKCFTHWIVVPIAPGWKGPGGVDVSPWAWNEASQTLTPSIRASTAPACEVHFNVTAGEVIVHAA